MPAIEFPMYWQIKDMWSMMRWNQHLNNLSLEEILEVIELHRDLTLEEEEAFEEARRYYASELSDNPDYETRPDPSRFVIRSHEDEPMWEIENAENIDEFVFSALKDQGIRVADQSAYVTINESIPSSHELNDWDAALMALKSGATLAFIAEDDPPFRGLFYLIYPLQHGDRDAWMSQWPSR